METFWLVIISVLVAAFIGGLTNFLAIKMLFHPRKTIYLGSLRMPFTPGIIPKRRDEIAISLGKIVSEHLVTQDSIRKVIKQHKTQDQMESFLIEALGRLEQSQESIGGWLFTHFAVNEESYDDWKDRLQNSVRKAVQSGMLWFWKDIGSKQIKELLPHEMVSRRDEYAGKLTDWILMEAENYLLSAEGQYWLEGMLNNILQRTSGLKGFVAGFFMSDPRMAHQVSVWLVNGLKAPELRMKLKNVISQQVENWTELTAEEGLQKLQSFDEPHSVPVMQEMSDWLAGQLVNDTLFSSLLDIKLGELVSYFGSQLRLGIPQWSRKLLNLVEEQLPVVLNRVNLPELVEQQVRAFPIQQVERIILEVSGREFRAITWLGALLGGMIGLIQSIFYLYLL